MAARIKTVVKTGFSASYPDGLGQDFLGIIASEHTRPAKLEQFCNAATVVAT